MIRGWFTVAYQPEKQPKWDQIAKDLKTLQNPKIQANALKELVLLSYTENIPPHLLMPVIQYTATSHNHQVIKYLLMFLENIDTRDSNQKLKPEFILIIDAIRNLLLHPNEYIRGAALRFLYKVNDREILSQLLTPILSNLGHNKEYVRRHSAILVGRLARDFKGFDLEVADSIIESFSVESDSRVLSAMLYSAFKANNTAAADLTINMKQYYTKDMKLALLKVTPETYKKFPQFRLKLLETVIDFCEDESISVKLQAAYVLRLLSNNSAVIKTTAATYCNLLNDLTDENQRAFVVQELIDMVETNRNIMSQFALEMAQGIYVTGTVKTKLLDVLVTLVTEENASSLISLIITKDIQSLEMVRNLLHRFSSLATVIASQVGPFIMDQDKQIAEFASLILKECGIAGAREDAFRYFTGVLEVCGEKSILCSAIWAISEFTNNLDNAVDILVGLTDFSENDVLTNTQTVISSDGTYSTKVINKAERNIKTLLSEGEPYLALSIVSALVRLKLKGASIPNLSDIVKKLFNFNVIEKNMHDICNLWISAVNDEKLLKILVDSSKNAFAGIQTQLRKDVDNSHEKTIIKPSATLQFSVLLNKNEPLPTPSIVKKNLPALQLTGPSDSLYIEAVCSLRKYDRVYHFTIYNQTNTTVTNILFEFSTVGSISILQRNDLMSLAPKQSEKFELPVMISSGSCGTLYGSVSFDYAGSSGSDHQLLPLSPINIDPLYCFEPIYISQTIFREKWQESIWETKVDIQTNETDILKYIYSVSKNNNLQILTPSQQMEATSKNASFVTANLFTRSIFGEEVCVNINAKLNSSTQKINGFIRIRSHDEKLTYLFGKIIQ